MGVVQARAPEVGREHTSRPWHDLALRLVWSYYSHFCYCHDCSNPLTSSTILRSKLRFVQLVYNHDITTLSL